MARLCESCDEPLAKADEFWVAAGASEKGELWHKSCWQKEISAPARVLFCPFCGGGTLLLGKDKYLWTCLKCKREFVVAYK